MCISNVAAYLRSEENMSNAAKGDGVDAFTASTVLAAAFCKTSTEVLGDLLTAKQKVEHE